MIINNIKYNPKSGCSFFRNLFLNIHKEELTEEPANGHHGVWKEFPYNNEQVSHSLHLVRNPYTRVVSMFTNKYIGRLNAQGKVFGNKLFDKILATSNSSSDKGTCIPAKDNSFLIISSQLAPAFNFSDNVIRIETVEK